MTKRMLANSLSLSMSEALTVEATSQSVNLRSKDAMEGVSAFLQKRTPSFEGR